MRSDYTEVFRAPDAVAKYEQVVYAPNSYSSDVDTRQREFLRTLVARRFSEPPTQHDFACGTGRALRALAGRVAAAHGYDTSKAMLAQARQSGVLADLHLVDATGPVPEPAPTPVAVPTVVTVFRLLLNAPPEVRERALDFSANALSGPGDGLLVLENHGNSRSLRHLRRRHQRDNSWFAELSHTEVSRLLRRHDFRIVERRGFALLPQGVYRRRWLRPVARLVDGWASRRRWLAGLATVVVYVAERAPTARRRQDPAPR